MVQGWAYGLGEGRHGPEVALVYSGVGLNSTGVVLACLRVGLNGTGVVLVGSGVGLAVQANYKVANPIFTSGGSTKDSIRLLPLRHRHSHPLSDWSSSSSRRSSS